ncbi:phosphotransferase [Streptomyces sp. PmtG]
MSPPSPSGRPLGVPQAPPGRLAARRARLVRRLADDHLKRPDGQVVIGHHNENYIVPLGWRLALLLRTMPFRARVKCRTPLAAVEVVPRVWPNENDLLDVVTRHLPEVPRCLVDFGAWSMHGYHAGSPLSGAVPTGPVPVRLLDELAEFFARTAAVPKDELPPLPPDWPADGDSTGFLDWLVDFTERRVHRPNRAHFDVLFEALGIQRHVMTGFKHDSAGLTRRPFCLLHTDVHRANIIVDRRELAVIDWELALYGDPLHDLATHVVRMDYDKEQQDLMPRLWRAAMERAGLGELTAGLDTDLQVYLDFEYAQSVFPDIMRAALSLPDAATVEDYWLAAAPVCAALRRAAEPLKLERAPDRISGGGRAARVARGPARGRCPAARPGDGRRAVTGEQTVLKGPAEPASAQPASAELTELAELVEWFGFPGARCVLFDFDGPLCRLFPGGTSERVARELRAVAGARGVRGALSAAEESSIDPHLVLRALSRAGADAALLALLEQRLTEGEVAAVPDALPTPYADRLVRSLRAAGHGLAVVTNNAPRAVAAYLNRPDVRLADAFGHHVHGRTDRPDLLKPHPDSLERALRALDAKPVDTLMIGDTVADLDASRRADVRFFVGYARNEDKAAPLRAAGAEFVVDSLAPLLDLVPGSS